MIEALNATPSKYQTRAPATANHLTSRIPGINSTSNSINGDNARDFVFPTILIKIGSNVLQITANNNADWINTRSLTSVSEAPKNLSTR